MTCDIKIPKKLKPIFSDDYRFKLLYGGRCGAKSHSTARYLLIKGMQSTRKILCAREIQKSIRESVHSLLKEVIKEYSLPYTVKLNSITCNLNNTEFLFHGLRDDTSKNIKSFEGVDDCWVEEAQYVSKKSLVILLPTIRKSGSSIIFTYNRFDEYDPVHTMFLDDNGKPKRDDVLAIEINYYDNPFCPDEMIKDAEECKKDSYSDYLHIWEGKPLQDTDDTVISIESVKRAFERNIEVLLKPVEIGIDVARFGKDRNQIYKRYGYKVTESWGTPKPMRTFEVAEKGLIIAGDNYDLIRVDEGGIGGGVVDDLVKEIGSEKVQAVNFGSTPSAENEYRYVDMITELFFNFKGIIDKVDLPKDQELLHELTTRKYKIVKHQGREKRKVESKDDYKKRYGKSPDKADAMLVTFFGKERDKLEYAFI